MAEEKIIWTALPNGIAEDGRLRVSVFVSPRLTTDGGEGTLEDFPNFSDWPSNVPPLRVAFEEGSPGTRAERTGPEPSSHLWEALFGEGGRDAFVRDYEFDDFTGRRIRSFPVEHIVRFLRDRYVSVATDFPENHPSRAHLFDPLGFGDIGALSISDNRTDVEGALERELEAQLSLPPSAFDPARDFARVRRFYRPAERVDKLPDPEIDFHEVVSLLSDFPAILRRLGLVLDLLVERPDGVGPDVRLRVEPDWGTSEPADPPERPRTAASLRSDSFHARSQTGEIGGGYLVLQAHVPVQIDADGAALKALAFGSSLVTASDRRSADTPEAYSLPALRSAGISVVRPGRAVDYLHRSREGAPETGRFARAKELDGRLESTTDPPLLFAEDVTQGYRVDVWDASSGTWRSLCRRLGKYVFPRTKDVLEIVDEGVVSEAMTEPVDGRDKDLRLHEAILRWNGWSLIAPRPGKVLDRNDVPQEPQDLHNPALAMDASFTPVAGSLPKLRYGEVYRLRARAVDIAGNSLPFDDPEGAFATEHIRYGRFEPVPPPMLLPRAPVTEGESLERVVIRSNFDTPAVGTSERHFVPPKTAQLHIEQHGLLDTSSGLDVGAYDMLAEGDAGTYGLEHPLAEPDLRNHGEPFFDTDDLPLSYLPDVLSRAVSLRWFGETTSASLDDQFVEFYGSATSWPEAHPFRLVVREGPRDWRVEDGAFVVSLEKADVARIRYSSSFEEPHLRLMGLWRWIEEALDDPPAELREAVLDGRHWMFTPFRELVVVHAVRQPLLTPEFETLVAVRDSGETFAGLRGVARVSRKSTERLDLKGSWTEFIDDLEEDAPREQPRQGHVDRVPVEIDPADRDSTTLDLEPLEVRHEFGDTKHRIVHYKAAATTRFAEYFAQREAHRLPEGTDPVEAPEGALILDAEGLIPESETVRLPKPPDAGDGARSRAFVRGTDYGIDYDTGEIWRLADGEIGADDVVEVVFNTPPITRGTVDPIPVNVPNTARPEAPEVLYAVPTFSSGFDEDGRRFEARRRGEGVRVYLERPWWSSGGGELLGVVTADSDDERLSCEEVPSAVRPFITEWGRDPIFRGGEAPPDVPRRFDFPRAVTTDRDLLLEEVGDEAAPPRVAVAGHEVDFVPERGLWSCDIDIDPGRAERPFVRLALCRYQPASLDGKELSPVVLADIVQLAPSRSITIVMPEGNRSRVRAIFVMPGPGPVRDKRVEVVRMERVERIEGDLGFRPLEETRVELEQERGRSSRGRRSSGREDHARWTGTLDLPKGRGRGETTRFLVREFDLSSGSVRTATQAFAATIDV